MKLTNPPIRTILPLSLLIFMQSTLVSQVGVNTTTPEQALDVNGRIQIGDDLAATDTPGSIKYNEGSSDLEGYTADGWQSLTSSGGVPSNAVFVTCRISAVDNDGVAVELPFKNTAGTLVINNNVPTGKFLLVTHVLLTPRSLFDFDTEEPFYSININFGSNSLKISGKYTGGDLYQSTAGYAPICVVEGGDALSIINFNLVSSLEQFDQGIDVNVSGFLVDDLDFN